MKGCFAVAPAKRRRTCFSFTVPVVVFLSLVGTVSVLLGLHTRFPSGYFTDDNSTAENRFPGRWRVDEAEETRISQKDESRVSELIEKFSPTLPKAITNDASGRAYSNYHDETTNPRNFNRRPPSQQKYITCRSKLGSTNSKGNLYNKLLLQQIQEAMHKWGVLQKIQQLMQLRSLVSLHLEATAFGP